MRGNITDSTEVVVVSVPPYLPRLFRQLARHRKQYIDRLAATDYVIATMRKITDGKHIDGPCMLRAVIGKAEKRDKKFGDALDLIEFER